MSDVIIPQLLRAGLTELNGLPEGITQAISHIGLGTAQFDPTDETAVNDTSDEVLNVAITDSILTEDGSIKFATAVDWDGEPQFIYSLRFYMASGTILSAYSSTKVETALVEGQSNYLYYTLKLDAIPADKLEIINTQVVFNPTVENDIETIFGELIDNKLRLAEYQLSQSLSKANEEIETKAKFNELDFRLKQIPALRPEMFGAMGNGITDDTAALTKFFAAITDNTPCELFGNYLVNPANGQLYSAASDIRIQGAGNIKVVSSALKNIVTLTGSNIIWDGVSIDGGADRYESFTPENESTRWALLVIEGSDVQIRSGFFKSPYLHAIRLNETLNSSVSKDVTIQGGVPEMIATYLQGIRVYHCQGFHIDNPRIQVSENEKLEEGVFISGGSEGIVTVRCNGAWDHAVYSVGCDGLKANDSHTITDGAGIVVSPPEYHTKPSSATTITGNTSIAATGAGSGVGMYLRDLFNAVVSDNTVIGFARSYQLTPVSYDNPLNKIKDIDFSNNKAIGWTEYGFVAALAGKQLAQISDLTLSGFLCKAGAGGLSAIHFGATAGITSNIKIVNAAIGADDGGNFDKGIALAYVEGFEVSGCTINDTELTGISLTSSSDGIISANRISSNSMESGIDGNNSSDHVSIFGNRLFGSTVSAIRGLQLTEHDNQFNENQTSFDDPLDGVFTLDPGLITVVNNSNINFGRGYTSRVLLTPMNDLAATNQIYVDASAFVNGVSFQVNSTSSAQGGELYSYKIVQ